MKINLKFVLWAQRHIGCSYLNMTTLIILPGLFISFTAWLTVKITPCSACWDHFLNKCLISIIPSRYKKGTLKLNVRLKLQKFKMRLWFPHRIEKISLKMKSTIEMTRWNEKWKFESFATGLHEIFDFRIGYYIFRDSRWQNQYAITINREESHSCKKFEYSHHLPCEYSECMIPTAMNWIKWT